MNEQTTTLEEQTPGDPFSKILARARPPGFQERTDELLQALEGIHGELPPLEKCLAGILAALQWSGDSWDIAKVMPLLSSGSLDLTDFENIMVRLEFGGEFMMDADLSRLQRDRLPCLFLPKDGGAWVIRDKTDQGFEAFDGKSGQVQTVFSGEAPFLGTVITFSPLESLPPRPSIGQKRWLSSIIFRISPILKHAALMTLLSNVFALTLPLYIMAVYDRVLATLSVSTLAFLTLGVALIIVLDFAARHARAQMLAFSGARFANLLGKEVFDRLFNIPLLVNERTSVGAKVPRIKDIERIRQFLFGSSGQAAFDLPFSLIFIAVVFLIGGPLGFVPLVAAVIFIVCGLYFGRWSKRKSGQLASTMTERQTLLLETISKMRAIKLTGARNMWTDRFETASASTSAGIFHNALTQALIQSFGAAMSHLTALATLVVGVHMVIAETMSSGGLIATMLLIWRIISPLQASFMTLTRYWQLRSSSEQITSLLSSETESSEISQPCPVRNVKGAMRFSGVALRYSRHTEPAASGISFTLEPGETMAVVGKNGSGKSSVLKLAAGLYRPQVGSIQIDDFDIRQFDPLEYRKIVAYAPQMPQFFEGTIRDNLLYSNPVANQAEITHALEVAGLADTLEGLPKHIDTPLVVKGHTMLSYSLLIRLSLARAFIKQAPIVLLDEPINGLDFEGDFAFVSALEALRGKSTVMVVTHRPGHIRAVDKVLYLENGRTKFFGPLEGAEDRLFKSLM